MKERKYMNIIIVFTGVLTLFAFLSFISPLIGDITTESLGTILLYINISLAGIILLSLIIFMIYIEKFVGIKLIKVPAEKISINFDNHKQLLEILRKEIESLGFKYYEINSEIENFLIYRKKELGSNTFIVICNIDKLDEDLTKKVDILQSKLLKKFYPGVHIINLIIVNNKNAYLEDYINEHVDGNAKFFRLNSVICLKENEVCIAKPYGKDITGYYNKNRNILIHLISKLLSVR